MTAHSLCNIRGENGEFTVKNDCYQAVGASATIASETVATSSQAPDSGQVRLALERITGSPAFSRSERLCRLLRFVTERTLAGHGNELKEYLIGVEVLEKGASFDPRLDSAVRVDARRLRAKLDEYYARDGAGDPVRIVLNKGSYAPSFEWPAKSAEEPPPAAAPQVRNRKLPIPAVLVLLGVIGLGAGWWMLHRNPAGGSSGAVSERDRELDMLVLQARHLAQRSSSESILRAIEYAGRSVAERPKSAPAYVVLGDAWLALAGQRLGGQRAEAVEHARRNAAKAAELDSTLAAPLTTLGAIAMDYQWQWREAEELFRRATQLNPSNGSAFARYARLLTLQGRHDEAIAQARHAETLAPTSVNVIVSVGHALFYARRYEEAARQIEKAIDHDPSYDYGRITLSKVLGTQERYEEAWKVADRIAEPVRSSAEGAALRAWLYGRQRRIEEGRREVAKAGNASSIALAVAWAALGESETALKVLEDATRAREPNVVYVKASPLLDPIRGPRLDRICAQIGLSGCAASR
jgi:tetratricopeptide (TPR) repeat protein